MLHAAGLTCCGPFLVSTEARIVRPFRLRSLTRRGFLFVARMTGLRCERQNGRPVRWQVLPQPRARFPPAAGAFFLARVLTSCDVNRSQPGTHLGGSKRGATACSARRTSSSSRPPRTHGTRPAVPSLIRIFRRPRSSSSMTPSTTSASLTPTSFAIAEAIAPS
jgi:hypothetical protein